jgi:thymidylate kinase
MESRTSAVVIKVDGIDGCGKSRLAAALAARLRQRYRVVETAEFRSPHDFADPAIGLTESVTAHLKTIALSPVLELDDVERQLLWIFNSRRHNRVIIPRLAAECDVVVVDRSHLSNIAFGVSQVPELEAMFARLVGRYHRADVILWVDTPVEICWRRLLARSRLDVVEQKGKAFLSTVRRAYAKATADLCSVVRLDGSREFEEVLDAAIAVVRKQTSLGSTAW